MIDREPIESDYSIPDQTVPVKKEDWAETMLLAYREGRSDLAVCSRIGIQTKQFAAYYRTNERFRDLVDFGRQLAESYWENQARENLQNKNFNSSLYKAYMAKHYGWTTKQETTVTNKTEYDVERLRQEVVDMLPDLMKLVPSAVPPKQLGHGS